MKLSENFTLDEFICSPTATRLGINNAPSPTVIGNLKLTADAMELIRDLLGGNPININSAYRSPTLNRFIGGSTNSAHCLGYAIDFTCRKFGTPLDICKAIAKSDIAYDQLINEGNWAHISFAPAMRKENLSAHFKNGKVTYTKGIA